MGNSLSVKVQGIDNVVSRVKLLVPRIAKATEEAVDATLLAIETDAKLLAPVDTGRLRSDIRREKTGRFSGKVATNVVYAPYVEFGTRTNRAQPFLGPAYERHRLAFVNNLKANTKLF